MKESLSINIFTTSPNQNTSTTGINGHFVFFQVLFDCVLRLRPTQIDTNELIDRCRNEYDGDGSELSNIREFEQSYSSAEALWWYTRQSFFYKTLNVALRTQDIHMIVLFRAVIVDIYHQLQKNQAKNPLRVYRSQLMSSDELDHLKQKTGHFISVNSFFSTSTEYKTALFFLGDITSLTDLKPVLFEIDADPKIATSKPFADITEYSQFTEESEVLFMLGSIFRLQSIDCNDDQIWIIRMTLCGDNEHDLRQVLAHMKQETGVGKTDFRVLGTILWNMGKFDLAEKYFNRLLRELPLNHPSLSSLYKDLAKVASQKKDYDMSVQWQTRLLELKSKSIIIDIMTCIKTEAQQQSKYVRIRKSTCKISPETWRILLESILHDGQNHKKGDMRANRGS